jgi:hypothetical protein
MRPGSARACSGRRAVESRRLARTTRPARELRVALMASGVSFPLAVTEIP